MRCSGDRGIRGSEAKSIPLNLPFIDELLDSLISWQRKLTMLVKLMGFSVVCGLFALLASVRAENGENAAIIGGAIGGALAASVSYEQRQPLRQYVVRERPRSYGYDEELAVGREFRNGPYGTQEDPEKYGVPGHHHYALVNNRAVIFYPHTRRIIHVHEPYDD